MTFWDDSAGSEGSSAWSDLRRRYFQKRYLLTWILAALLPFILLRLLFVSEIAFPFQSAVVSSPAISFQPKDNVSPGQNPIIARSPGPAPEPEDFMSKTSIPDSPLIRPDEDAWITHDDWINHDLNRTEDDKIISAENSTDVMKDFSQESANGEGFGLPEDNEKEELQSEAMEMIKSSENTTDDNRTVEELSPQEQRTEVENLQQEESIDKESVKNEGEKGISQQEIPQEEERVEEEEKQVEVNEETMQGVKQVDKEVDRPQQDSDLTHEETPAGECDLFDGVWEHYPEGPLYTNSTCFFMQGDQNCLSNGRPDTEYLYWRWKPRGCDLPRFDAKSFLDKFRGKALGFVGDSIARNQMQSLLCLLSQVEIPIKTYASEDDKTVRWLYKEHQVMLACVWSPYLLNESEEGDMGFEKGQSVLYLDVLDSAWTSVMQDFDVMVFLTGQWYYKPSVYIEQAKVIGCHYCSGLNLSDISYYQAYRSAIRQVLGKVSAEYRGVTIMNTFPLSHFENGSWDTGGYCKRELPLQQLESTQFPGDHSNMHDIVIDEFNGAVEKIRELKKDNRLEILDVTKVSLQRADGHPGPFRRPHPYVGWDPNLYYPNDCLHWCIPGPVDTWNELLVQIVHKYL